MSGYEAGVRTLLARLLLMTAVMLMPLGMTTAPVAAAEHHSASMPMRHCPEQGTKHQSKAAFAECTMACASALPAVDRVQERPVAYVAPLASDATVQALHGLHPETETPPPRTA